MIKTWHNHEAWKPCSPPARGPCTGLHSRPEHQHEPALQCSRSFHARCLHVCSGWSQDRRGPGNRWQQIKLQRAEWTRPRSTQALFGRVLYVSNLPPVSCRPSLRMLAIVDGPWLNCMDTIGSDQSLGSRLPRWYAVDSLRPCQGCEAWVQLPATACRAALVCVCHGAP